jgi:hypothetical protein
MTDHRIPELDRKGLRKFGLVTGTIVGGLFGLFFPWLLDRSLPLWPWIVFGILGGFALFQADWLRPIYFAWMRFGLLANKVTTPLVLGIVFFLVISPISLFRRIMRWDALKRRFDANSTTYRIACSRKAPRNLEKPF